MRANAWVDLEEGKWNVKKTVNIDILNDGNICVI